MKKRLISLALAIILAFSCLPQFTLPASAANTSGSCGENLTWSFAKSTGTLTIRGSGEMQDVWEPNASPWNSIKEDIVNVVVQPGVTHIGYFAFFDHISLKSVSLPDTVASIGGYAFGYTALKTVTIPKKVTKLGSDLFSHCRSLEEVNLPDRIEYVGVSAFEGCSSLKRIDLPKADTVCDKAFKDCTALKHASIPALAQIPAECFSNCKALSDLTVCPHLELICSMAFAGCTSLKNIPIPTTVYWIRDQAFYNSGLESIRLPLDLNYIDEKAIGYSGDDTVVKDFTIYGYADTGAQTYAEKNNIRFVALDGTIDAFMDVPAGAFYRDAVGWAVENGVTNGLRPDTFAPNNVCTRAQVVTFLWRAMGSPEPTGSLCPFTDVKETAYYYKAVLWALENEVTTGTGPDAFSPDLGCTRGQVVTFLWRAAGKPASPDAINVFTDVAEDKFYTDAVLWAVEQEITNGMTSTTFVPDATCTRGQIVTFLYRAVEQ